MRVRGFSLVELVAVIAILSITAAIALPHWAAAHQTYGLNLAAQRIAADLAYAQSRANYGSAPVTVSFSTSANNYQIPGIPDPDRPAQTYTVSLSAAPYRVTLSSVAFGNATPTQLTFDGFGTPTAGGSLVITAGGASKTLSVDPASGSVSIQ